MSRLNRLLLLIGLLLFGFWLRLYQLDGQSLWWDEGISLHLATSSFAEIVANRVTNIHPPLYFFLLKIWVALTGTTAFAARYFSVMASFLQMPLVFALLRRWFGRNTAVIGLVLTAVWSLSVIYGQEVRVYAFLPLIYLALLLLTQQALLDIPKRKTWLWLALLQWIGLHLHYNILFLLIFLNGWALWRLWRTPRLWTWLKVQTAVGLGSLPWAISVILNRLAGQAQTNLASFSTEPPVWSFIIPQVWGFHLTGLVNIFSNVWLQMGGVALILLIGLLSLWARRKESGRSAMLLLIWLLPLGLGFSMWLIRSFSHPRYISLFAFGFVLLLAYLLTPHLQTTDRWAILGNLLRLITAILFFSLSAWGLGHYFFDPAFAKDDMRQVAQILKEETSLPTAVTNNLILIPKSDWSLPFIYDGDLPIQMADAFDPEKVWIDLADWTKSVETVFTLDYANNFYDWQGVVPVALESAGNLVQRWQVDDLILSQYRLDMPVVEPQLVPRNGRFGDIVLLGSWVNPTATTADGVTVAVKWRLLAPVTHNYSVVFRVDDGTGMDLAYRDDQLLSANGRPTNRWQVGEEVTTYHFVPFVEGIPPLSYDLMMRVYIVEGEVQTFDYIDGQGVPQGQALTLGEMVVKRPSPNQSNVYGFVNPRLPLPEPFLLADGLLLTHVSPDQTVLAPGQQLLLRLRWQATTSLPDLRPRFVLRQDGQELVVNDDAPVLGRYPTNLWQAGDVVLEQRPFLIPATAKPGPIALFVELDGVSYLLAEIEISTVAHTFAPPLPQMPLDVTFGTVARLVGFDPPPADLPAGQPVPLTLYWQALGTGDPIAYTVFTQILAEDGRLIAQHDAPPQSGTRPTTGWVGGEFIIDAHLLTFREPTYVGAGQLVVGLYDPVTGMRLQLPNGQDAFSLPLTVTMGGEPN
jgi:4-amino-4-deoxy-L-arabinose transferase-like glycosyltransferase